MTEHSGHRQDLVHGLRRDRQEGARERGRHAEARDARARRQRSRHRAWTTWIRKPIAKKIFFASFVNSGQVCMAIKRIYAHEKHLRRALRRRSSPKRKKAKVGNGLDPDHRARPACRTRCSTTRSSSIIEDTKRSRRDVPHGRRRSGGARLLPAADARHRHRRRQPARARRAVRPDRADPEIQRTSRTRCAAPTTRATA